MDGMSLLCTSDLRELITVKLNEETIIRLNLINSQKQGFL